MTSPMLIAKHVFLFLLVFFFQIPLQVNFAGQHLKICLTLIILLFLINTTVILFSKKANKKFLKVYLLLFFLFIYYLLVSSSTGFQDLDICKDTIYGLMIFVGSSLIVDLMCSAFGSVFVNKTLLFLVLAAFAHTLIMLLTAVSPAFSHFLYSFVLTSERSQEYLDEGMRYTGLFFSGFGILSVYNAIALTIGCFLFFLQNETLGYFKFLLYLGIVFILFIGITFSGRTGFVIMIIGSIFYLGTSFFLRQKQKAIWRFLAIIVIGSFVTYLLFWGLYYIVGLERQVHWIFEFVFRGGTTNSTVYILENMFFLPDTELGVLFGTGNFGRSFSYIASDLGYILMIHFAGVFGLFLAIAFYLWVGKEIFWDCSDIRVKSIGLFIIVTFAVGNFKDVYYFSYSGYSQQFFILVCLALKINWQQRGFLFSQKSERVK